MLFCNPQGNSEVCEKEIGLFYVVFKSPFETVESNTQLCSTEKLTLQFMISFSKEKPITSYFGGGDGE